MPTHRRLVGRITLGLLLIVVAAACRGIGPDLRIAIDNESPKEVTVTVDTSGSGRGSGRTAANVRYGEGAEWSVPLGSTWEVKVDGKHVIGSGDRTDLALPSPGQPQDVMISIRVKPDGTVVLLDAH